MQKKLLEHNKNFIIEHIDPFELEYRETQAPTIDENPLLNEESLSTEK